MTREEAMKILCPETSLSALADYMGRLLEYMDTYMEACKMAVAALRAQQEPNPPLTLEELREMDGEPVWVENPNGYGYKCERGWALVYVWSRATDQVYLLRAHDETSYVGGFLLRGGKIYRRKPEEGTI